MSTFMISGAMHIFSIYSYLIYLQTDNTASKNELIILLLFVSCKFRK